MAATSTKNIDELSTNTIRITSAEMVQKANSGHPGMPMGMAPIAQVLWSRHLRFNPSNPKWLNRDRFLLSNGHGCALQYVLLHLAGYPMTLDDLKAFRQIDSKTPGHPESHFTEGIEVTTGPLGQGIGNAVGLAIAQSHLAAVYNKPGYELFNNHTYVFAGDGCMQEGVACEAVSLAGHLGLNNLVVIYDNNHISIDGPTDLSFTEDVSARFRSYNWNVIEVTNGDSDFDGMDKAIQDAKAEKNRPTLINLHTTIGFGSKKQGTAKTHGEALGEEDLKAVKTKFGFDAEKSFQVPAEVYNFWGQYRGKGAQLESQWSELFNKYASAFSKEHAEIKARFDRVLPENWESKLPKWKAGDKAEATRSTSGTVLNALADMIPAMIGGSADLTPSNKTELKRSHDYQKKTQDGRYIRFGVREHGMAAIGNGLAAYGGYIPFTATFFNFIEYCFPSVRLAALSHFQQFFIMTHDSIGLGEDGPTHQPVEALALCRATPNVLVLRPADGNETTGAYIAAIKYTEGPSVFALSRADLPQLPASAAEKVQHGAYVVQDPESGAPNLTLVASGSEVAIALDAAKLLASTYKVRVVSMPASTLFDHESVEYRRSVIPVGVPTFFVEAATSYGLERYCHFPIAMTTFGASGKAAQVYDKLGLSAPKVAKSIEAKLNQVKGDLAAFGGQLSALPIHYNAFSPMESSHTEKKVTKN